MKRTMLTVTLSPILRIWLPAILDCMFVLHTECVEHLTLGLAQVNSTGIVSAVP